MVGNLIKVIAHTESQQAYVIDTMVKPGNCVFEGFEPWEDDVVILTFRLLDFVHMDHDNLFLSQNLLQTLFQDS